MDGFWIDITPATNRQFAALVKATGHVTVAEKTPEAADYPGARPEMLRAGSLVFEQPGAESTQQINWSVVLAAIALSAEISIFFFLRLTQNHG